jgi:O-methyltransferase involved in polyketide biosynthesis
MILNIHNIYQASTPDDDNKTARAKRGRNSHFLTLSTDEEKKRWSIAEYADFCKVDPDDGLDFSGKTSMRIAYERDLESQREDALFNDHLARYFVEPYGKRLSIMSMLGLKPLFDPNDDIGFGWKGHIWYTAARTQLVNDRLTDWLQASTTQNNDNDDKNQTKKQRRQVLNLGAGVDTRAFWLESLKGVADSCYYIEVDTAPVLKFKEERLQLPRTKEGVAATTPLCHRKVVTLDFSKESVQDLYSLLVEIIEGSVS